MLVSCPSCAAVHRLGAALDAYGALVSCNACGHLWVAFADAASVGEPTPWMPTLTVVSALGTPRSAITVHGVPVDDDSLPDERTDEAALRKWVERGQADLPSPAPAARADEPAAPPPPFVPRAIRRGRTVRPSEVPDADVVTGSPVTGSPVTGSPVAGSSPTSEVPPFAGAFVSGGTAVPAPTVSLPPRPGGAAPTIAPLVDDPDDPLDPLDLPIVEPTPGPSPRHRVPHAASGTPIPAVFVPERRAPRFARALASATLVGAVIGLCAGAGAMGAWTLRDAPRQAQRSEAPAAEAARPVDPVATD